MDMKSSFRQCPNGHWYDATLYDTCPQCAGSGGAKVMEDYGVTEAVWPAAKAGAAQPSSGGVEDYGPTEPAPRGVPDFDGRRGTGSAGPVPRFGGGGAVDPYGPTMPVEFHDTQGFSPVTGWLVCVEGPDRGRDYPIRTGYNHIGRADHMDICITGDSHISRERHAMIAYDPEERLFYFGPGEGKSLVRLNGKLVMSPCELHAYDAVTLGATKLLFVPFCGERFNWDE